MSIESIPNFTDPAAKLWATVPTDSKKQLLSNVWCGKCRHEITITRTLTDESLLVRIEVSFEDSQGIYGSPRVHRDLREDGIACGEKRVVGIPGDRDR